jgi:hypothetical protein
LIVSSYKLSYYVAKIHPLFTVYAKKVQKTPGEASRWGKLFRTHCLPSRPIAFSRRVFIVISARGAAVLLKNGDKTKNPR